MLLPKDLVHLASAFVKRQPKVLYGRISNEAHRGKIRDLRSLLMRVRLVASFEYSNLEVLEGTPLKRTYEGSHNITVCEDLGCPAADREIYAL